MLNFYVLFYCMPILAYSLLRADQQDQQNEANGLEIGKQELQNNNHSRHLLINECEYLLNRTSIILLSRILLSKIQEKILLSYQMGKAIFIC
ncbi:UNKNOWN [Stylonychia lemnae]|uniref:Secreted protein n=1 Tax=Stylonychia lemnae TaxID=5949 RepID=A0A078B8T4_STYLE|nr:UNKNOWN [Stylonychia lemnae]|eukprot:CDW90900.1 UNKNOWN [Stylonychia lemnae]